MESIMRIEDRNFGDVAVVKVHGDIVLNGSAAVLADRIRTLLDQNRRRIVLDLADVRYVDSGGLGELIEAFSAAKNRGGAVKLLGVTKRLNDLLGDHKAPERVRMLRHTGDAIESFSGRVVAR